MPDREGAGLASRTRANDDSARGRLARGSAWVLASTVAGQGSALLLSVALARLFGTSVFGEYALVLSTITALGVFAGFGLAVTATKHVAELRQADAAGADRVIRLVDRTVIVTGGLTAVALLVLAPVIAASILGAPSLTDALRLACVLLVLNEALGVQLGILAGFEAFRSVAIASVIRGGLNLLCAVIGAWAMGLTGAIVGMTVAGFASFVIARMFVSRERRRYAIRDGHGPWAARRILWTFSVPALIGAAVVGPAVWVGNAILANQPDGLAQVGIYNAAFQWRAAVLLLPTVVGQAALPILTSALALGQRRRARRILLGATAASGMVAVPASLVLIVFAPLIMGLYGAEFRENADVLQIVAVTIAVAAVMVPVGQMLAAANRMWTGAALNIAWAATFILCAYAFLSPGGARELALAYLVAYCLLAMLTLPVGVRLATRPPAITGPSSGSLIDAPGTSRADGGLD